MNTKTENMKTEKERDAERQKHHKIWLAKREIMSMVIGSAMAEEKEVKKRTDLAPIVASIFTPSKGKEIQNHLNLHVLTYEHALRLAFTHYAANVVMIMNEYIEAHGDDLII